MRKCSYRDEQIVGIVCLSHADDVPTTSKKYKVSSHTMYIWRKKHGRMEPNNARELKRIKEVNARLKMLVTE